MTIKYGEFCISDDKNLIQIDKVHELLAKTYWASNRSKVVIQKSIENSLCFGIYKDNVQIGFARCVTDYAFMYWLGDVIIDEKYRGQGLGKALMKCIKEHEYLVSLVGFLNTKDAHGLYEQFGFQNDQGTAMRKPP